MALFLMMLNSIVQPNYVSTVYFLYSLVMTMMLMTRDKKVIQTKFTLSISMIAISFLALAIKCILVFLMLKDQDIPTYTKDDLLFYRNLGIIINQKDNIVENFQTFFFDTFEGFLSIFITLILRQHYNDFTKPRGFEEGH